MPNTLGAAQTGSITDNQMYVQAPLAMLTTTQDLVAASSTNKTLNFILVNTTAGALTFTIWIKPTAATANADAYALCKAFSVVANTTNSTSLVNIPVPKGYVVSALASAVATNILVSGLQER